MIATPLSKPTNLTSTEIAEQVRPLAENRVILNNISWDTFERLLADIGDRRKTLFHYINGTLEIMSPLSLHEGSNRFIEALLGVFTDELEIDMRRLGSLLMKIPELKLGAEPDSCYYIQNEPIIRGKEVIIVGQDPAPDLVLEVDITNPSDRRLPIYALLAVPEVWRYDGYSLEFLALDNGAYQPIEKSLSFPDLPAAIIVEYVQKRLTLGESGTLREFRKWVRENVVRDEVI
ncbi:MAG: Uma2 family endonuclease [Pseudanabaena sp. M135S2SP2A07QC]|nr:Uma2 family endonuclease [Pseudanabaena sp. M090S1SP2A07QC]MCA6508060.1 Uma2 family endonuclease [Pseudanabaena sp. M172S2SP2A07QC]MCA6519625.1 Uma2 family endonuclease [Pseudanabaena sp. M110S1SP2A07QC]MCA6521406.1 Uma2 family endonuclease [Pseudanabaena sp. M051S1SP2A07QC]MCA6531465.1 Uma2 family endonuclease [Pseudanabaena sp. M125S2SP2A07QC]MCA6534253.1 Uma2 family endonuclease [Pseudanabaena sp. M176S2SP2A07QC]MCA6539943.1 Uma2 family endonuclease [Pseudanabaena sp. M037S2SP2A07QC]MC